MCGAPKSQTITQKTELDPNLQRLLYGGIFPGAPAAQPAAPMSDNGGGGSDDRDSNDMLAARRGGATKAFLTLRHTSTAVLNTGMAPEHAISDPSGSAGRFRNAARLSR
jgi:hypothetical protein